MTIHVTMTDAKRRLEELVDRCEAGEHFVVTKRGKPFAQMVPFSVSLAHSQPNSALRRRAE